jgi:hypothetical protein
MNNPLGKLLTFAEAKHGHQEPESVKKVRTLLARSSKIRATDQVVAKTVRCTAEKPPKPYQELVRNAAEIA